MRRLLTVFLGGRLQHVLIACFALVAVLTVGLSTVVTSRVIDNYLREAETDRVARDMALAEAFYQLKLDEVAAISHRLVLDRWVVENMPAASAGAPSALQLIDQQITNKITVLALGGTHLIAVLDNQGHIVTARVLSHDGELSPIIAEGNWRALPIVQSVLAGGDAQAATEVIPAGLLQQVGLTQQARVPLLFTEKASPVLYDPREGSAGFAQVGVSPLLDASGQQQGAVLAAYLFNNDFTLVDRIKEVAGVDTVTIFFGDLRVSTNVMTETGERAVGTRVSQEVYDVVLAQGADYEGRAFVVNDWFITRYRPLRDYQGRVVGSLYVGARESVFQALVQVFNSRVLLIALVTIGLAAVIAVPISRLITRPIEELVGATGRLAQGDMAVRVAPEGSSELVMLGASFNQLAETLQQTQQALLHKERLASMGQLAAGVAHEINNPLGTILLFAGILRKEMAEDDPRREDLQLIIDEAERCKKIVADLLNFARQQQVLLQQTDVNALLEQVAETLQRDPSTRGVEVSYQLDPALPFIQADSSQLQQVFINLMRNACEAMPEGGVLTLRTRLLDGQVEIQVSDTGAGIAADDQSKVFTPFFTTKPVGKGTGLGLSIVYGIIKMHRGQITVHSEEGVGATFSVALPIMLSPQPAAEAAGVIG